VWQVKTCPTFVLSWKSAGLEVVKGGGGSAGSLALEVEKLCCIALGKTFDSSCSIKAKVCRQSES